MSISSLIFQKFAGNRIRRSLKNLQLTVARIQLHEEKFTQLTDRELILLAQTWKTQLSTTGDEHIDQALKDRTAEAFALLREATRRMPDWNLVPYDVQLIGGLAMAQGHIAEMATGEGKTLAATLPVFLHALAGRGVHVVTANAYLAKRDAEWMGRVFQFLGLSVGCIHHDLDHAERKAAYQCEVTYGTSSEFGFDYLRDNAFTMTVDQQVQRPPFFALVDEIDSVLIDEARTPLIITQPSSETGEHLVKLKPSIERLVKKQNQLCGEIVRQAQKAFAASESLNAGKLMFQAKLAQPNHPTLRKLVENPDALRQLERAETQYRMKSAVSLLTELKEELYFWVDAKQHEADLTEKGRAFLSPNDPDAFLIPEFDEAVIIERAQRLHGVGQLLKAYCLYEHGVHYIVQEGEVVIVDENTGHVMPGRRWSDGLHQAVEAKENVKVERETETVASITLQNYFRLYPSLAGMTGTAMTDADEFEDIYGLSVMPIPPNRPNQRLDLNDVVFGTRREKYRTVIKEITDAHAAGQPVLVGTPNVEASETVSRMLQRKRIPHNVLNARNHAEEADVIARAGEKGAVTVSTNMAGRGTDICLAEGVANLGGLYVIGCERYESRRVDRQLRGRSARQGDPGKSRFFVSFEDELLRHFGNTDWIAKMLEKQGEDTALEHPMLSRSIEGAQRRVEEWHAESRKHTLQYDNILSQQRRIIYERRNEILQDEKPRQRIFDAVADADLFAQYDQLTEGLEQIKEHERQLLLQGLDRHWREHLHEMDALREMVRFQSHAQKDPLLEYRRTGYEMFNKTLAVAESAIEEDFPKFVKMLQARQDREAELSKITLTIPLKATPERAPRNAPCPCGSGMKHKRCCGK
jgi:preprotein translocase subunit SecA